MINGRCENADSSGNALYSLAWRVRSNALHAIIDDRAMKLFSYLAVIIVISKS